MFGGRAANLFRDERYNVLRNRENRVLRTMNRMLKGLANG